MYVFFVVQKWNSDLAFSAATKGRCYCWRRPAVPAVHFLNLHLWECKQQPHKNWRILWACKLVNISASETWHLVNTDFKFAYDIFGYGFHFCSLKLFYIAVNLDFISSKTKNKSFKLNVDSETLLGNYEELHSWGETWNTKHDGICSDVKLLTRVAMLSQPLFFHPFLLILFCLFLNHISILCKCLCFCSLFSDQSKSSIPLCSRDECVQRLASLWEKTQLKGAHSFHMAMTQHITPHRKVLSSVCIFVCVCVCVCAASY